MTMWQVRAHSFIQDFPEKIARSIAWMLPKRVAKWAFIRVHTYATVTDYTDRTPEQVDVFDALKCWENQE